MANPFLRIQTADPINASVINRIQSAIAQAFSSITGPFVTGGLLSSISVFPSQTKIPHKLGYKPKNIFLGCPSTISTVYSSQASDDTYIYLTASTYCVLNIWVS
jgi:hypothetical protein